MTCIASADNTLSRIASCPNANKSIFTCTSTRDHVLPKVPKADANVWMESQQESIRAYRSELQTAFIKRNEHENNWSDKNRRIALTILLNEAARYNISINHNHHSTVNITKQFVAPFWQSMISQVKSFVDTSSTTEGDNVPAWQRAIENISSMGIWYQQFGLSMPSRQYQVLCFSHHELNSVPVYNVVTVVGLCQFGYSNFVMDDRMKRQATLLQQLQQSTDGNNTM